MIRINIGCGQTPTKGWQNYDNSLSLRLAKIPILPNLLGKLRVLESSQCQFIQFSRENQIEYGDATKGLPLPDSSVDVIYTSHMLEHLDRNEADSFFKEVRRLLRPGGIIRIVVPCIKKLVEQYIKSADADAFIETSLLCIPRPRSLEQKLRVLLVGTRHHQWMYDGNSLCALLHEHGFVNARVCARNESSIENHEPLDLDERGADSVCVEAGSPGVIA